MTAGTAAFILCSTRSGSTWLALMLGRNARAVYLGELNRMLREEPEGCSLCMERSQWCPLFHDIERLRPDEVHAALQERSGRDVLVDNSKSLSWARKTLDAAIDKKYIHLLRDPRAVVYSWQRRGRTKGLEQWIDENYEIRSFLNERSLDHYVVTYNELAEHTGETMPRLCDWLGLSYDESQTSYWEVEHHGAGRNGATASFLNNYVASDEAFYAERRRTSFHDMRWQTELDAAMQRTIEEDARLQQFLADFGFTLTRDGLRRAAATS